MLDIPFHGNPNFVGNPIEILYFVGNPIESPILLEIPWKSLFWKFHGNLYFVENPIKSPILLDIPWKSLFFGNSMEISTLLEIPWNPLFCRKFHGNTNIFWKFQENPMILNVW
jgi:hypothetical protein